MQFDGGGGGIERHLCNGNAVSVAQVTIQG